MIAVWLTTLLAYLAGRLLVPHVLAMLAAGNMLRPNYQGEQIPVGAGILLMLAALPSLTVWQALAAVLAIARPAHLHDLWAAATITICGFTLLGLLDDSVGSGRNRGLAGHFRALLSGEMTTGAVKAGYGCILALTAAWVAPIRGPLLLAALLIGLAANTVNLFDLRPGRALKVFFIGYGLIALTSSTAGGLLLVMPAAAAALLPWDLRAKAMLGDTGANVLGAWLGLFLVTHVETPWQWAALVALAALHIYAEKRSLTDLIAKAPALNWLDMLGRH